MKLWKATDKYGVSCHGGGGPWIPGMWREIDGPLKPGSKGLHLCTQPTLLRWLTLNMWEAETDPADADDNIESDWHGLVARSARVTRKCENWTRRAARKLSFQWLHHAIKNRHDVTFLSAAITYLYQAQIEAFQNETLMEEFDSDVLASGKGFAEHRACMRALDIRRACNELKETRIAYQQGWGDQAAQHVLDLMLVASLSHDPCQALQMMHRGSSIIELNDRAIGLTDERVGTARRMSELADYLKYHITWSIYDN